MHPDTDECDSTRNCTDTVRESALKDELVKNPLPHLEFKPASVLLLAFNWMLYQLSCFRLLFCLESKGFHLNPLNLVSIN